MIRLIIFSIKINEMNARCYRKQVDSDLRRRLVPGVRPWSRVQSHVKLQRWNTRRLFYITVILLLNNTPTHAASEEPNQKFCKNQSFCFRTSSLKGSVQIKFDWVRIRNIRSLISDLWSNNCVNIHSSYSQFWGSRTRHQSGWVQTLTSDLVGSCFV